MRIAVAYDNGLIYKQFNRSPRLKIYDFVGRQLVGTRIIQGWSLFTKDNMTDLVKQHHVNLLICDRIGVAARIILATAGVEIRDRMYGDADRAVTDVTGVPIGLVPPVPPMPPKPMPKPVYRARTNAKHYRSPVRTMHPPHTPPAKPGPHSSMGKRKPGLNDHKHDKRW